MSDHADRPPEPTDESLGQSLTSTPGASLNPETHSVRTLERVSEEELLRRLKRASTYTGPSTPETQAPPEAVAAWIAHYAPGPGCSLPELRYALGRRLDLAKAGPGFVRCYKEARAAYWFRGGGTYALEFAADYVGFSTAVLAALLLVHQDLGDTHLENRTEYQKLTGGWLAPNLVWR